MPGTMRKLGLYLGLVQDDEDGQRYDDDRYGYDDEPVAAYAGAARTRASPHRRAATAHRCRPVAAA